MKCFTCHQSDCDNERNFYDKKNIVLCVCVCLLTHVCVLQLTSICMFFTVLCRLLKKGFNNPKELQTFRYHLLLIQIVFLLFYCTKKNNVTEKKKCRFLITTNFIKR